MKKISLFLMSIICLFAMSVYADGPCDTEQTNNTYSQCQNPCDNNYERYSHSVCPSDYFLCTKKDMNSLFQKMSLSGTQICTAQKIQDKYEQEILSIEESLQCAKTKLSQLKQQNCTKSKDLRDTKKLIKRLEKKKKEICKCYEKQFEALLSDMQKKSYRKYKK